MTEWRDTTLVSLGRFASGKTIKPGTTGAFKAYGSNGIIGGSPKPRHTRGVIIGRVGAHCGSVARSREPFWASDNTIVIEPACDDDLDFLYYLLLNSDLNQHAGGSAQPLVTQTTLKALTVRVPEPSTRVRIGAVLGSFDDLIANNRRRIEVLQHMAEAIYGEWFVRFRYPGHEKATLADSILGPLPEGWEVQQASALMRAGLLEVGDGYRAKNAEMVRSPMGLTFVRVGNVRDGHLDLAGGDRLPATYRNRLGSKVGRPGDAVISMKGTVGRAAFVHQDAPGLVYSPQVSYWRSLDHGIVAPSFIYSWIRSDNFREQCAAVKGATDMADYVNLKDQRNMLVLLPPRSVMSAFDEVAGPAIQAAGALRSQSDRLTAVRDLLLPKLVTGQIDVSHLDLDAVVETSVA